MSWEQTQSELIKLGMTPENIEKAKQSQRQQLQDVGMDEQKIMSYFGEIEPTNEPIEKMIKSNMDGYREIKPDGLFEELFSFWETAVEGSKKFKEGFSKEGLPQSSTVMAYKAAHGEKLIDVDALNPDQKDTFYRVGAMSGQIVGDLPVMVPAEMAGAGIGAGVGGVIGGTIGSIVPGAGTVAGVGVGMKYGALVGAGLAGAAVPEAIRSSLIEFYEKGGKESKDYLDRLASVATSTAKQAIAGGATMGIGGAVFSKTGSRIASNSTELATMTALTSAMEGELPEAHSFWDAAIMVGGLHAAGGVASKMMSIYKKTGIRPEQVLEDAGTSPALMEQLSQDGVDIPDFYKKESTAVEKAIDVTAILKENAIKLSGYVEDVAKKAEPDKKAEAAEVTFESASEKLNSKIDNGFKKELVDNGYNPDNISTYVLDKYDIVKKMEEAVSGKKEMDASSGYALLRNLSGSARKAQHFIEYGTFDIDGNINGPGLKQVIDEVSTYKGELKEARNYLMAKRFLQENQKKGIQKFVISVDEAKKIVGSGNQKFEKFAKEFTEWNNRVLKYGEGILFDKEKLAKITDDDSVYISWKRVMDDVGKGKGSKTDIIKALSKEGSERQIKDPFLTAIENAELITKLTDEYRALGKAVDNILPSGVLEKKKEVRAIEISKDEIKQKTGLEIDEDVFEVFRSVKSGDENKVLTILRNGKVERYVGDETLIEALKSAQDNPYWTDGISVFARALSGMKRAGITSAVNFPVMNFGRDLWQSIVKNDGPPLEVVQGAFDSISKIYGKTPEYWEYMRSGSGGALFKSDELALNTLKRSIELEQDPSIKNSVRNVVTKPVDYYAALLKYSDLPLRMNKFQSSRKKGKSITESALLSREETVDFDVSPLDKKLINYYSMTSFAKVGVNGIKNIFDTFKNDPKTAQRALFYITVPAVLNYLANRDDERYQAVADWERLLFIHVPLDRWEVAQTPEQMAMAQQMEANGSKLVHTTKDGKTMINTGPVMRLPFPHVYGALFAFMPVAMLHSMMSEDKQSASDLLKKISTAFSVNTAPDLIAPAIEQATNYNFFTETKLVSGYLEKQLPYERQTEYTSETAKQISKFLAPPNYREEGVLDKYVFPVSKYMMYPTKALLSEVGPKGAELASPVVIDHYIRSWTGGVGQYVVQALDFALRSTGQAEVKVKPEWTEKDLPFFGSFFTRYPSASTKDISDFLDAHSKSEMYINTLNSMSKELDPDLERFMVYNQDKIIELKGFKQALDDMRSSVLIITKDKENYTPQEKRQMIDSIYYMMNETARMGLKTYRQVESEMGKLKKLEIEKFEQRQENIP